MESLNKIKTIQIKTLSSTHKCLSGLNIIGMDLSVKQLEAGVI